MKELKRYKDKRASHASGMDMLEGPLFKKIWMFALPIAASSILQQLFTAADTAVVGRFASSQAMAAVGSNNAVINLIVSMFMGLSVGANVSIASQIGHGEEDGISDSIHTSITLAIISGIVLTFAGIALAKPLLHLGNSPDDVFDLAVLYIRIYFLGMPMIMLFNFGAAILRSMGDSQRPLYALLLAGVINVLLNLVFVIGFRLSVVGVAAATVISNTISAGLVLWFLCREEGAFHLDLRHLRIKKKHLIKIVQIGIPAGMQGMVFSVSNTVIASAINLFGSAGAAGSAAALNFEVFSYYSVGAFVQTTVTFTSQNFAAGKYDRCKKIFRITFLSGLFSELVLNLTFYFLRGPLLGIFTTDPEVLYYANIRITRVLILHWMLSSYEISGSTLRGMNYSLTPSILMIFGTCVFRVFWVTVLFPAHRTFEFLLSVYPASWLLTGTLVMGMYFIIRRKVFKKELVQ